MTWVLVVLIYAGAWAKGDSVTMSTMPAFKSEQDCKDFGNKLQVITKNTTKEVSFVCVKDPR